MRDQYKVLIERYAQVQEAVEVSDKEYEFLVNRLIEMYRPEDKDEFLKFLNQYQSQLFVYDQYAKRSRITSVQPELIKKIQQTLDPTRPLGTTPEFTLSERLSRAVFWGGQLLTFRKRREEFYNKKNAIKHYEEDFYAWSKAKQARDELYKDNPGVNIDI